MRMCSTIYICYNPNPVSTASKLCFLPHLLSAQAYQQCLLPTCHVPPCDQQVPCLLLHVLLLVPQHVLLLELALSRNMRFMAQSKRIYLSAGFIIDMI